MIRSLDDDEFKKYGKICSMDFKEACNVNNFAKLNITQLNVSLKSIKSMECINSPIIIGPVEGITLLCVSEDEKPDIPIVFILGKPILLNEGVYYNIVPLYGVCSVLLAKKNNYSIMRCELLNEFIPIGIYPRLNINKIYTFFYQIKDKDFVYKGEKHNFWEMTYVDKGTLISIVDGVEYKNVEGELIFYSENQYHIQHAAEGKDVSFVTITFDMDFNDGNTIANKTFCLNKDMIYIIRKMLLEKKRTYFSDDLIICYLKILIINLIRNLMKNNGFEDAIQTLDVSSKYNIENSIVEKSVEYIQTNIYKKINLSDIADYVHISKSYLSALFKKNMNTTIVNYVNEYRLELSKELINNSNDNFTEISLKLGYNSIHYFSRQFKAYFGITPSEYAKSIEKNKNDNIYLP